MIDITNYIVAEQTSVVEALSVIDKGARGVAFVCDSTQKVLGSLSDGDIRRFIMRGGDMSTAVQEIMHRNFRYLTNDRAGETEEMMRSYDISAVPILDSQGKLLSIRFDDSNVARPVRALSLPVVIMAGGKGTRLYPYTQVLPKPLIPIGDYTITEHIMKRFVAYDCCDFEMIVNHKRNMIKAYFSESEMDWNVSFVDEDLPMGTGGGLKLLEDKIKKTFFMTNCDILIDADYSDIYDYHKASGNIATMVCATKKVVIPYGTVEVTEQSRIIKMSEKPAYSFLTNTGMYLFEPEVFQYIPENTFIHITDIIQRCIDAGHSVGAYPISEAQWSDMGQIPELKKMYLKMDAEQSK